MKSIVEQASSVMKAIENGWLQAGKPAEFTVKVYEHGVKNFFGMSVEPAKICILYEDKSAKNVVLKGQQRQEGGAKENRKEADTHVEQRKNRNLPLQQPLQPKKQFAAEHMEGHKTSKEENEQADRVPSTKIIWTDELVEASKQWLTTTLAVMNKSDARFNLEAKKYHLIITFAHPVLEDQEREKALFRSFSYVLMQSLRNRFKKGLRGFRIILNSNQP